MKNARSRWPKKQTSPHNVHRKPSNANEVESASRRRRFAMERLNVPAAKTKKIAISASRGDAPRTLFPVDRASVCQSMSSATQSFHAEMAPMSRRTFADRAWWSQTPSKDRRALRRRAATDTARSSAATGDVEAQRLCVRDATDVAMEAMNRIVQFVVSWLDLSPLISYKFFSYFRLSRSISQRTIHRTAVKL